mmetsp:Transcript_16161/g.43518  ORF Transcript_16161/g.43518 Transcript_16161/m.43518 type:complete len:291 (+) Transcript_16161:121-993(+)
MSGRFLFAVRRAGLPGVGSWELGLDSGSRARAHRVRHAHARIELSYRVSYSVGWRVLPDSNPIHLHVRVVALPRGQPFVARLPKVVRGVACVQALELPRQVVKLGLVEVAIDAAHSQVHDDVELLVVGRAIIRRAAPRVFVVRCPVRALAQALLPEGLVELCAHDHVLVGVHVHVELLLIPVEAKDMPVVRVVRAVLQRPLAVVHVEWILVPSRAPVQRAPHSVRPVVGLVGIAPALHEVDLAAGGPLAVGLVLGEEPDGGPQPVSPRQLGAHLEPAVLEAEALVGSDLG